MKAHTRSSATHTHTHKSQHRKLSISLSIYCTANLNWIGTQWYSRYISGVEWLAKDAQTTWHLLKISIMKLEILESARLPRDKNLQLTSGAHLHDAMIESSSGNILI